MLFSIPADRARDCYGGGHIARQSGGNSLPPDRAVTSPTPLPSGNGGAPKKNSSSACGMIIANTCVIGVLWDDGDCGIGWRGAFVWRAMGAGALCAGSAF